MANSRNKCTHCSGYFRVEEGFRNNKGFFCSPKHYIDYVNNKRTIGKTQQKCNTHQKSATVKRAFKDKSYASKYNDLVLDFNKLRRTQELLWFAEIGAPPTCISCSVILNSSNITNGHYITVASSYKLAIDPVNSYLQCAECNGGLSGNINGTSDTHGYNKGLEMRFGDVVADEIISYCTDHHPEQRLCDEEIIALRKKHKKETKKNKERLLDF